MRIEKGTFNVIEYQQTSLPQKPRLAPWVNFSDLDDERLQFRASDFAFTLRTSFLIEIFKSIKHLLNGSHTVDEISSFCGNGIQPTTVTFLLKILCAHGLLQEGQFQSHPPLTSKDQESYKSQLTFLSHFVTDPQNVLLTLLKTRVMVLGSNELKKLIINSLSSIGITQIRDHENFSHENNNPSENFLLDLKKVDFLVACHESPAFSFFEAVNQACLETGTRWMRVAIEGTSAFFGPSMVPSQTACYSCYDRRLISNIPDPEDYLVYKNQVNKTLNSIENGFFPPLGSLLASLVAIEVAKIVSGFAAPTTLGRFYKFQGLKPSAVAHQVLRVPRCPVCCSKSPPQDPWHSISPFSKV